MSERTETFEDAIRKFGWPEDIETAAVNLSDTISLEREVSEQSMSLQVWQTMMIARALLAERERCAKIAENYRTGWAPDADNIAEAIRQ